MIILLKFLAGLGLLLGGGNAMVRGSAAIAAQLGTSVKTVKVHRGRVLRKMEVGSLAELVRLKARLERNATVSIAGEAPATTPFEVAD